MEGSRIRMALAHSSHSLGHKFLVGILALALVLVLVLVLALVLVLELVLVLAWGLESVLASVLALVLVLMCTHSQMILFPQVKFLVCLAHLDKRNLVECKRL